MTDPIVLSDDARSAALELRAILAEERALAQRKASVKAILAQYLTEVGQEATDDTGEILAKVKAGSLRFNAEQARRELPEAALKMILVEQPDPGLARSLLPPALYEKCCTRDNPSIVSV